MAQQHDVDDDVEPEAHAPISRKGTDPLFEQKGWCQFPGSFELDFPRKPRKVL